MKKQIFEILKSKLFKNFSYLSLSHIVNFLFPIFTFPYITRILEPQGYGTISFLQSFVSYFVIIADYGLGLIAPSLLAKERDNVKNLSKIFHAVIILKFLFIGLSAVLISFFVYLNKGFYQYINYIYVIFLGSVIFSNINPNFFFQAVEEMRYITYINIAIKSISVVSLFLFVTSSKDILIYLWINTASIFASSIISFFYIYNNFSLVFVMPSSSDILGLFKKASFSFFSVVFVNFYVISNEVFLGIFFDKKNVGFYSAPYRIVYYVMGFVFILSQVIYPKMSILSKESICKSYAYSKKIIKYVLPCLLFISFLFLIFSKKIILIVLGYEYLISDKIFKIMSFIPIFLFLSNLFGTQIILASGNYKKFFYLSFSGFMVNIISNLFLTYKYGPLGACFTLFLTEFSVFVISYLIVKRMLNEERKFMRCNSNL